MFEFNEQLIFQAGPSIVCFIALTIILFQYFKSRDSEWMLLSLSVIFYLLGEISTYFIDDIFKLPVDAVFYVGFYVFAILFIFKRSKGLIKNYTLRHGAKVLTSLVLTFVFFIMLILSYIIFFYFDRTSMAQPLYISTIDIYAVTDLLYPILDIVLFGYYLYINKFFVAMDNNMFIPLTLGILVWTIGDFLYFFEEIFKAVNYQIGDYLQPIGLLFFVIVVFMAKANSSKVIYTTIDIYSKKKKINNFSSILLMLAVTYLVIYVYCINSFGDSFTMLKPVTQLGVVLLLLLVSSLMLMYYESQTLMVMLTKDANTDPLTGLYTRKHAFGIIHSIFAASKQFDNTITAFMIDIDNFKECNDEWGHLCGDRIIKGISQLIMFNIDPSNIICRYGGEEFLIVLPGIGAEQSMKIAENLRREIEDYDFYDDRKNIKIKVTVSIGAATTDDEIGDEFDLIRKADAAMYKAKEEKNKCLSGSFPEL